MSQAPAAVTPHMAEQVVSSSNTFHSEQVGIYTSNPVDLYLVDGWFEACLGH